MKENKNKLKCEQKDKKRGMAKTGNKTVLSLAYPITP